MGLFSPSRSRALARVDPQVAPVPVRRDAQSAADGSADLGLGWPTPQLFGLFGVSIGNTGVPVSPIASLQISTAYSAASIFGNDIGKLPIRLKRRSENSGWVVDTAHPINRLLERPNGWQTPIEFWAYLGSCYALRRNAYAVIMRGAFGQPTALIPIHPDRVSVMLSPRGWLFYNVSHPAIGDGLMLHQDDMLHLRGMCVDGGYIGLSPIAASPDVFGLAIAAQQHAATLFRNGAQVAGVLTNPKSLSPEAAARMAQSWRDLYGGVQNSHKTAVLEEGTKFERVALTSTDAQLLESRKFSVIEVCRMIGVPPHKVYDLTDAHYSNIENVNQDYIDNSLQPPLTQIEQRCRLNLLFEDERADYVFEADFRALLRGDRQSRYAAYGVGLDRGFLSINEVRAEEGMNPIEGGDGYRIRLDTGALPAGNEAGADAKRQTKAA